MYAALLIIVNNSDVDFAVSIHDNLHNDCEFAVKSILKIPTRILRNVLLGALRTLHKNYSQRGMKFYILTNDVFSLNTTINDLSACDELLKISDIIIYDVHSLLISRRVKNYCALALKKFEASMNVPEFVKNINHAQFFNSLNITGLSCSL